MHAQKSRRVCRCVEIEGVWRMRVSGWGYVLCTVDYIRSIVIYYMIVHKHVSCQYVVLGGGGGVGGGGLNDRPGQM